MRGTCYLGASITVADATVRSDTSRPQSLKTSTINCLLSKLKEMPGMEKHFSCGKVSATSSGTRSIGQAGNEINVQVIRNYS